ncbi:MAG TPA: cytidylate kinase-like family protein [Spirochaetes bacterium]|nr:cytidylate kinase-like family protein [Spirochaetota bacterium]
METDGQEWHKLSIERKIGTQIGTWTERKEKRDRSFVTISREFGAEGWILGQKLEHLLNKENKHNPPWVAYNKEILKKLEEDQHLSAQLVESLEKPEQNAITEFFDNYFGDKPSRIAIYKKTARVIKTLASNGHVILVGRGGCFITHKMNKGFHVRCVAPFDFRVQNIMKQQSLSQKDSEKLIQKMETERDAFVQDYFFTDVSNPHYYDLVINTSRFTLDDAVDLIYYSMEKRGLL